MQQQQTNVVSVGPMNSGYNQPGPVGVVQMPYGQPLARTSNVVAKYRHLHSLYFGVAMIVAGALSIVFNIVDVAVGSDSNSDYYYYNYYPSFGFVGHGFWSGIMCVIAGSFGVGASRTRTAGMIRAFLVLSIIAASCCLAQMGVSIAGACIVAYGLDSCRERNYEYDHYSYSYYHGSTNNYCSQVHTQIAMESLLAILSLVGGVSAICGSTLGCRAACCCSCCCCENYPTTPANGIMYYNTPMTVVTQQQQQQQQQPQGVPQGFQYIHPGQPYAAGQPAYIAGSPPYNPPSYNQPATLQPAEKF